MKKFEEDVPLPESLDVSAVSDSAIPSDEFEVEMLRCGHDRSVVNLCQPLQLPSLLDDGKVQWIDSVIQRIVHHPENMFRSGLYSAFSARYRDSAKTMAGIMIVASPESARS